MRRLFDLCATPVWQNNKGVISGRISVHDELFYTSYEARLYIQVITYWDIANLTLEGFEVLRHALGISSLRNSNPTLGWRNYYMSDGRLDPYAKTLSSLVKHGYMARESGSDMYYCTRLGRIVAGALDKPLTLGV